MLLCPLNRSTHPQDVVIVMGNHSQRIDHCRSLPGEGGEIVYSHRAFTSLSTNAPSRSELLRASAHSWEPHRPGDLAQRALGVLLDHLESYLPDQFLRHLETLLLQSRNDLFGRGVQAEAVEGVPDCSFRAGGAHVVILPGGSQRTFIQQGCGNKMAVVVRRTSSGRKGYVG
jgi:hypothetical protein